MSNSRSTPTAIRRMSVRFLLYLPYYRPSICNNDGPVTFERLTALRSVPFLGPVIPCGMDLSSPTHRRSLRDTNKTKSIRGEGHQSKLLGRESREVNGMQHNLLLPGTCECGYSGQKRENAEFNGWNRD